MAITITEILGTDSLSAARLVMNSNFLLLENAYNDLEESFNINVLTGSMDVSAAPVGSIKAKSFIGNSLVMPSSSTPNIQIYGTGANAGSIIVSNTISGATGIFSNIIETNQFTVSGESTFNATGIFNETTKFNSQIIIGPSGSFINKNRIAIVDSSTPFPSPPDSGLKAPIDNPYILTLTENVIYINSSYYDGSTTGFFMQVSDGGPSNIPAGYTITLIDTANTPGLIATGITGPSNQTYYTGFSVHDGSYPFPAIQTPGIPYKSSITLMWEPRIDGSSNIGPGSWVIISSTPGFIY